MIIQFFNRKLIVKAHSIRLISRIFRMIAINCPNELPKQPIMIVTPFQIFCYQNREQTATMNPHLKGTAITSILAKMWRSLDHAQKQHFEEMSLALRQANTENKNQNLPTKPIQYKPEPVIPNINLTLPKINIIPHRLFGRNAAEASSKATSGH